MDRQPWELSPDEIVEAKKSIHRTAHCTTLAEERDRAIATAAQKRLVEWLLDLAMWQDEYSYWYIYLDDLEKVKAALEVK